MSYDIVKGLKLKKDVKEVWIKASSSNVTPRSYHWEELKGLSALYKHHGEDEITRVLLRMYWEGTYQPGAHNNYYKAVTVFQAKNPQLDWGSVGEVKDEDLYFGPIEDLPKYLNIQDRRVEDIVKRRLKGETFNRKAHEFKVVMTRDELSNKLLDIYVNYRKRKKGKFIITYGDRFISAALRGISYNHHDKDMAMIFTSWEDAAVFCAKHHFKPTNIIEEK